MTKDAGLILLDRSKFCLAEYGKGQMMNDKKMYYTIGEFSRLTGLPSTTLRYYDQLGLIRPEVVKDSGYRMYSGKQLLRWQFIRNLKCVGLSLEDIQLILESGDERQIIDKVGEHKRLIQNNLRLIENFERYMLTGLQYKKAAPEITRIEDGILPGCNMLITEFTGVDFETVFAYKCQILQNLREQRRLVQMSGMRILLNYLGAGRHCLAMPVQKVQLATQNMTSMTDLGNDGDDEGSNISMGDVRTFSCLILTASIDVTSELERMKSLLAEQKLRPAGEPIIECLLDPGDMVDQEHMLARLHTKVEAMGTDEKR